MAYIGRDPAYGNLVKQTLTPNSVTTNFALDYPVATAPSILVSVGGVVQSPDTAYSILNGSTIVFSEAPATGLDVFIIYLGRTSDINTVVDNGITEIKLAANAVTTSKIADGNVTTAKIADSAITTAKIADGNVITSKIADNAITTAKIAANAVVSIDIADGNVITSKIADNAITTIKLSNFTVTSAKLDNSLTISGVMTAADFNSTSDITLKENINPIDNSLDIISRLNGIQFTWKNTGEKSYGLSAQEVEKILPEIVRTREDGNKGINYLNIIAFLIEAVKDLSIEVDRLKNK